MIRIVLYGIVALMAALEYHIYRKRLSMCGRKTKVVYYTISGIALLMLFAIQTVNHILNAEIFPVWLIQTAVMSFILNLIVKTIYSLALFLGNHFSKKTVLVLSSALLLWLLGVMIKGLAVTKHEIEVKRVVLEYDTLPESFDGVKIALFSDVHLGSYNNPLPILHKVADSINMLNADIVVQCGDLTNLTYKELEDSAIMEVLGEIDSKYGIYGVIGNHDLGIYAPDTLKTSIRENTARIVELEQRLGWHVLQNQTEFLHTGTDTITITGIKYPQQGKAGKSNHKAELANLNLKNTYKDVPDRYFNITLSHAPQVWHQIINHSGGDLTLSGHVHSMQIKLRIGKSVWSPARILYSQWSGLYEKDKKYLYINDGIGCSLFPLRIGVRPEITLIELRKEGTK